MYRPLILSIVVTVLILPQLLGCSVPIHKVIEQTGGEHQIVTTDHFKHLVALSSDYRLGGVVVVYVEGDGTPWINRRQIAKDPTPENPVLLEWFATSNSPSLYLGRPCYFNLNDEQCSVYWYTHGRYSDRVVQSMVDVLNKKLAGRSLILVGHSGGGTLVMLMAERMNNVSTVVTIAGNLSVKQWTEYHQYSTLTGSLDPMFDLILGDHIKQIHVYTPNDEVIKADWIKNFASKQRRAELIELPVEGHSEGWRDYREAVMNSVIR